MRVTVSSSRVAGIRCTVLRPVPGCVDQNITWSTGPIDHRQFDETDRSTVRRYL